jgi:hypothetical protein
MKALVPSLALVTLCAGLAVAQQQTPPAQTPPAQAPAAQTPPAQAPAAQAPPAQAPAAQAVPPPAPQPAPCSAPEFRQLDFWVGEWDLAGEQLVSSNPVRYQSGRHKNSIQKTFDGCVIQENFDDLNGFHGMSVSTYDAQDGKWKQTWVDNAGNYIALVGEFKDGKMVFTRHTTTRQGRPVIQRMVFSDIKPDSFSWNWESSADEGKTWRSNWKLNYTRKKT